MQCAKTSKIPDLETRIRTSPEHHAIYEDELEKLSLQNQDIFQEATPLQAQACKASKKVDEMTITLNK